MTLGRTNSLDLILSVPKDLAAELVAEAGASPHIRETRVDPDTASTILVAVASAGSTVIVTEITREGIQSVVRIIRRWLERKPTEAASESLSIRTDELVRSKVDIGEIEEIVHRMIDKELSSGGSNDQQRHVPPG